MNIQSTLMAITGVMLLAAGSVSSSGEYDEYYWQRGPMPFEALDLNADGVITAEEHATVRSERQLLRSRTGYRMRNAGYAPVFEAVDQDGNGVISRTELQKCHVKRMQQRWN